MISYTDHTLAQYLEQLSSREPVPGGGSAAAVAAGLGAALIAMSARYALGKGKPADIEERVNAIVLRADGARKRFLELAGLDAAAYQQTVRTRKAGDAAAHGKALAAASAVPQEIIALARECLALTPYLHQNGNPHLTSDVKAAESLLSAAISAAGCMLEANS